MTDATHSCGFHCMRPGCIEARAMEWEQQRKRIAELEAERDALKAALANLVREAKGVADDYHRPRYARLDAAIASVLAAKGE